MGLAALGANVDLCAAGEVDAEIHAHEQEHQNGDDREGRRQRVAHAAEPHEAEFRVLGRETEEFHGVGPGTGRSDRNLGRPQAAIPESDHHPRHRDRGDDRGDDAEAERDREAAHRPRPEQVEDERGHEHRHVGVDDGGEGALEAGVEGGENRTAEMRLLADALVDQHVRIDRHADGEHDAGDARQRQRRAEQHHRGEDEQDMHGEREVGEDSENAVGRNHVHDDQDRADKGRALAGVDRVLAQARPDRALLDHGELGGQRAGAQQDRQAARLVHGEIAGDLAGAAGDGRADDRRRDDLAVEHDGERPADILGRDPPELLPAAQIEAEGDVGLAGLLVEALLGVDQVLAVDHHALLHGDRAAALLHRQRFDLVRRIAGVGDELEVELGGLADDLLELGGVLKPGHLDQHPARALLGDFGLLRAHRVDAAVQDLDRLRHGVAHLVGDGGVGQGQLNPAVGLRDVEGAAVAAGKRAADRLAQRLQQTHRPCRARPGRRCGRERRAAGWRCRPKARSCRRASSDGRRRAARRPGT